SRFIYDLYGNGELEPNLDTGVKFLTGRWWNCYPGVNDYWTICNDGCADGDGHDYLHICLASTESRWLYSRAVCGWATITSTAVCQYAIIDWQPESGRNYVPRLVHRVLALYLQRVPELCRRGRRHTNTCRRHQRCRRDHVEAHRPSGPELCP